MRNTFFHYEFYELYEFIAAMASHAECQLLDFE